MSNGLPSRKAWAVTAYLLWLLNPVSRVAQQFFYGLSSRFELSDSVEVPQADADTLARLEQAKAFAADQQFDEAIEALRQVMEQDASRVIAAGDRRYVSVREYCHMRLAALPGQALAAVSRPGRRPGNGGCSKRQPWNIAPPNCDNWSTNISPAASATTALVALGDIALEQGEHGEARSWWEKLIPTPPQSISREPFDVAGRRATAADAARNWRSGTSRKLPLPPHAYWLRGDEPLDDAAPRGRWSNSGTRRGQRDQPARLSGQRLDMASIRARLVLVSILEGSLTRAVDELNGSFDFARPARGRLGGLEVNYVGRPYRSLAEGQGLAVRGRTPRLADSPRSHARIQRPRCSRRTCRCGPKRFNYRRRLSPIRSILRRAWPRRRMNY